jgi:hypothetical protein
MADLFCSPQQLEGEVFSVSNQIKNLKKRISGQKPNPKGWSGPTSPPSLDLRLPSLLIGIDCSQNCPRAQPWLDLPSPSTSSSRMMTFEPLLFAVIIGSDVVEVSEGLQSYHRPPLVGVVVVLALVAI